MRLGLQQTAIAGVVLMATLLATKPALAHFRPAEFGLWYPLIDNDLLSRLDRLRDAWGSAISISPVQGGVGRADDTDSQHNVIHTLGAVRAVDVFPAVAGAPLIDSSDIIRFVELAKRAGFTGIGVYRDTTFQGVDWTMIHLDVRPAERIATWARIDGTYTSIDEGYR